MSRVLPDFYSRQLGPSALIAAFTRELGFHEIINSHVQWDEKQCKLSPGAHAEAMLINILTSRKPMYKVIEFFKTMDVEALFGPCIKAEDFNDDALGRTLDRLYEANLDHLYGSVVVKAHSIHSFDTSVFHGDTSRLLVTGEYANASEETLLITQGYNAQGIKNCKQITIGTVVNKEGIPIKGSIDAGNQNDSKWNEQVLSHFPEMMKALESPDAVYVADSKLICKKNLRKMRKVRTRFISRLPGTFAIAASLKHWAFKQDQWVEVPSFTSSKNAAVYRVQETTASLYRHPYRFVVVHSSKLDERKAKALENQAKKEKEAMGKACKQIMKQTFACEADAINQSQLFLKENEGHFFSMVVEIVEEIKELKGRGRPKEGTVYPTVTTYRIQASVGPMDQQAWTKACQLASTFVLITSLKDKTKWTAEEILKLYKEQQTVELRFKFLKNPIIMDGVFLKTPERIKSLGYLFLLALLIFSLLELKVRRAVAKRNRPLKLPYRSKVERPTGMLVLEEMKKMTIVYFKGPDDIWRRYLPAQMDPILLELLQLAGFDESIYLDGLSPVV